MNYLPILVGGATNAYLLYKDKDALLIDPGAEAEKIIQAVNKLGLNVEAILLTHAHGDHIGALNEVRDHFKADVYLHEEERVIYENEAYNMAPFLGFSTPNKEPDHYFKGNEELNFNLGRVKVLHTPGHTPGSSCFLLDDLLFSGDTLFQGSIGRTDLPMGDWSRMEDSLRRLKTLDDKILVLSGHGGSSTIGAEKKTNPFLLQLV